MKTEQCANCSNALAGPYCQHCGQKRFEEGDRRLGHLLAAGLGFLTDLDGRLLGSLRSLFFRPGLLSQDYLAGRRRRWMSPVALALLATALYFFAPGLTDLQLPFKSQMAGELTLEALPNHDALSDEMRERALRFRGQVHSQWTGQMVRARVARRNAQALTDTDGERGYTVSDYAVEYDRASAEISKLLVIVHVPIIALGLALLFWCRRMFLAEHLVVALHLFAFYVLFIELVLLPGAKLAGVMGVGVFSLPGRLMQMGVLLLYTAVALRRVYTIGWALAVPAALATLATLFLGNLVVYRTIQFLIVFTVT